MFFYVQNSWSFFFFLCKAYKAFPFLVMQSSQSFFVSCCVKFMKFFCVLPSKFIKLFYCCFLLCKACGAFFFLIVQSSQNFSLSCHVELEELLYFLLCRTHGASSILQLAFWTNMCIHLLYFVFNFLFLLEL
jgi:hypothetical protein